MVILNIFLLMLFVTAKTNSVRGLLLASMFIFCTPARAFDEWSDADVKREAVMIGVTTIDWLQTRNIARHNCTNPSTGEHDCYENGPAASFIGSNPSVGQVNNYFAASMLAHIGFVTVLPSKYRAAFQFTSIVYEASYVAGNYKLGISAKF